MRVNQVKTLYSIGDNLDQVLGYLDYKVNEALKTIPRAWVDGPVVLLNPGNSSLYMFAQQVQYTVESEVPQQP